MHAAFQLLYISLTLSLTASIFILLQTLPFLPLERKIPLGTPQTLPSYTMAASPLSAVEYTSNQAAQAAFRTPETFEDLDAAIQMYTRYFSRSVVSPLLPSHSSLLHLSINFLGTDKLPHRSIHQHTKRQMEVSTSISTTINNKNQKSKSKSSRRSDATGVNQTATLSPESSVGSMDSL